jgi:hypothetical protein
LPQKEILGNCVREIKIRSRMPIPFINWSFNTKIARQALAGPFRPRQAIISRLRRTTNAIKNMIAGKA